MAPQKSKKRRTGKASSSRVPSPVQQEFEDQPDSPIHPDLPDIDFSSDEQERRFRVLVQRPIRRTRYADDSAMNCLGIRTDVYSMFRRLGMNGLLDSKASTFTAITLEFLSSLDTTGMDRTGKFSFRLFNNNHQMKLDEVNCIFGFPRGKVKLKTMGLDEYNFWRRITRGYELGSQGFHYSTTKASYICNPAIRYAHRILSHSIYGRGDSDGVVRQSELLILHHMLTPGRQVDIGHQLVRQLSTQANRPNGDIVIGGLITEIANYLQYDLGGLAEPPGSDRIDLDSCIRSKMIIKRGDDYYALFHDQGTFRLPNPDRTTVANEENWLLAPGDDQPQPHPQPQPPPPQPQPPPYGSTSSQPHGHFGMQPVLDALHAIHDEQRYMRETLQQQHEIIQQQQQELLQRQHEMLEPIYHWHHYQGHFDETYGAGYGHYGAEYSGGVNEEEYDDEEEEDDPEQDEDSP